jgi:uncharacterized membrane protein YphA (DoxX/SURF4 family)
VPRYIGVLTIGRVLFAIAVCAFGVQALLYGHFSAGLPPWPPSTPGAPLAAYVLGVVLILCGVCFVIPAFARQAALGVTVLFGIGALLHLGHLSQLFTDGQERTRFFEPLALGAAALVLYGVLEGRRSRASGLERAGRYVFAFCLIVFGAQHFEYAPFIASLIPAWMPGHLPLAYFTGSAFIAAGVAIATGLLARLGAALVGLMFFLWVAVLHGPRVSNALLNGNEWSSLFVALGMAGACWIVASTFPRGKMDIV